jgi:hypothetical protein
MVELLSQLEQVEDHWASNNSPPSRSRALVRASSNEPTNDPGELDYLGSARLGPCSPVGGSEYGATFHLYPSPEKSQASDGDAWAPFYLRAAW